MPFSDNDEAAEPEDNTLEAQTQGLTSGTKLNTGSRSKRTPFSSTKVQRSQKDNNMYWLIRIPGK